MSSNPNDSNLVMSAFQTMIIIPFFVHFMILMMIISALMFKCIILVIRSTLEKMSKKELERNQRRPRSHHTQQAYDLLIFVC